jgi:hypothetical protein
VRRKAAIPAFMIAVVKGHEAVDRTARMRGYRCGAPAFTLRKPMT